MTYPMLEKDKIVIKFEGAGDTAYPKIQLGIGDNGAGNSGMSFISKPPEGLMVESFARSTGTERSIRLVDEGINIKAQNGTIKIEHDTGTYFEITVNGNDITLNHKTSGVVTLNSTGLKADIKGKVDLTATGPLNVSAPEYNFL
ncbi:hypothetical protein D1872_268810 [compost metagenome]